LRYWGPSITIIIAVAFAATAVVLQVQATMKTTLMELDQQMIIQFLHVTLLKPLAHCSKMSQTSLHSLHLLSPSFSLIFFSSFFANFLAPPKVGPELEELTLVSLLRRNFHLMLCFSQLVKEVHLLLVQHLQ
jgi:hypothetical protein